MSSRKQGPPLQEPVHSRPSISVKKAVETGIAILEGNDYEKEIYEETFFINKDT